MTHIQAITLPIAVHDARVSITALIISLLVLLLNVGILPA